MKDLSGSAVLAVQSPGECNAVDFFNPCGLERTGTGCHSRTGRDHIVDQQHPPGPITAFRHERTARIIQPRCPGKPYLSPGSTPFQNATARDAHVGSQSGGEKLRLVEAVRALSPCRFGHRNDRLHIEPVGQGSSHQLCHKLCRLNRSPRLERSNECPCRPVIRNRRRDGVLPPIESITPVTAVGFHGGGVCTAGTFVPVQPVQPLLAARAENHTG